MLLIRVRLVLKSQFGQILFIHLELWRHGNNLLHGANVSLESFDDAFRIEIPERDAAVVRGREECTRGCVNVHGVDKVAVTT